jgi:hypothetical protein
MRIGSAPFLATGVLAAALAASAADAAVTTDFFQDAGVALCTATAPGAMRVTISSCDVMTSGYDVVTRVGEGVSYPGSQAVVILQNWWPPYQRVCIEGSATFASGTESFGRCFEPGAP